MEFCDGISFGMDLGICLGMDLGISFEMDFGKNEFYERVLKRNQIFAYEIL